MPIGEMKGKSDPAGRASQTLHTQTLIHRFQTESHKVSQSFPRCRLTGWCEDPEAGGCRPGLWPQALWWSQVSQWERTCLPIQEMPRDRGLIPGSGRSPGEGMAIPSSILAWKISWREEPGWLLSMGSQRARPDLATEHTCYCDPSDTGDLRSIHLEWSRKQGSWVQKSQKLIAVHCHAVSTATLLPLCVFLEIPSLNNPVFLYNWKYSHPFTKKEQIKLSLMRPSSMFWISAWYFLRLHFCVSLSGSSAVYEVDS